MTAAARDGEHVMQAGAKGCLPAEQKDGSNKKSRERFAVDNNPQLKGRLTEFRCVYA
jgi:hypothetical protein